MTNRGPESYDVSGCFHVRLPSSTQIVHFELHPNIIDSGGRWKMAFSPGAFITRSQGLRGISMVEMVDMVDNFFPLWTIWSLPFNQLAGKNGEVMTMGA